jgi:hypothetical protein
LGYSLRDCLRNLCHSAPYATQTKEKRLGAVSAEPRFAGTDHRLRAVGYL